MNQTRLLIAEDDLALAALLEEYLESTGYDITLVNRGDSAIECIEAQPFDLVLTDLVMPGANGMAVLSAAQKKDKNMLVLLMTAYSGIDDAIHAIEQGAYDFVSKPFQLPEIRIRLDNAARYQSLLRNQAISSTEASSRLGSEQVSSTATISAAKAYGMMRDQR